MEGIEIIDLVKKYGHFEAISKMNLTIPDGSFCVFLGPSGCGKSTTLNCVAGLESVTSGQIKIGGVDATELAPHQRNIAMVFQSSLLYPHLTARQNILMSLKNTETPKAEIDRRFEHAVSILDIEPMLDKRPSNMSGGQRQRVAMAKAIVREPAAFLMDEPLAALDASLRQSLRADLVVLQKRLGTTTIFVTHDQVEAMTMGDMIVVMNEGRVEQVGSPREIYDSPATKFVAGFIGSPPMNFFDGEIKGADGALVGDDLTIKVPTHLAEKINDACINYSIGVRPQHIVAESTESESSVGAEIVAVENLGKEAIMITKTRGGATIRVLVSPDHTFNIGDKVFLVPDLSRSFLFENRS